MGTFNSWVLSPSLQIGGDAYGEERFFNLFINLNHPFTYSVTFCNSKIKEHLTQQ